MKTAVILALVIAVFWPLVHIGRTHPHICDMSQGLYDIHCERK